MSITAATSNVELNDLVEQGTFITTVSDWVGDKGKYFCEAAAIASFYVSRIPGASAAWTTANVGLNNCKKILAFPGAIKGSMALYEKLQKGGESVRNLLGDACYVMGDTIDGFRGMQFFGILTEVPASLGKLLTRINDFTGVDLKAFRYADRLAVIKDMTGVYGLGNTAYNAHVDIGKLRQIDLKKVTHPEIKDAKKALELKKNWVTAEIDNKWQDRLRCLTACAMCSLGLLKTILVASAVAVPFGAWTFAVLGTVGVYAKYNMYASKVESGFWQNRYAELIPAQSAKSQLLKAAK